MSRTNRFLGLLYLTVMLAPAPGAIADTIPVTSAELRVEDEEVVLNAQFDVVLNPTLEEALQKGVVLYFVQEFELARPRWYWFDEKVIQQSVQYRVSYSALTRQYLLKSGLLPGQQLNSLEEVERQLSRVVARPVAQLDQLTRATRYDAGVRLRLDVTLLPKPFQINALASRDWSLQSDWYRFGFTP
jgi:hypothetical protein